MPRPSRKKKHRPHKPGELGPRVYLRGRFYWCDLRPWDGQRIPMRNPKAPSWPLQGEGTEDPEVAARWVWSYLDAVQDATSRKQLGKRAASKPVGLEVARYLGHIERTGAATTLLNTTTALTVHFAPFVGEQMNVEEIDDDLLQRWVDSMLGKGYKSSTVGQYLTTARIFLRWRSNGKHDPGEQVRLPAVGERDVRPLTDKEIIAVRAAADTLDRETATITRGRVRRSYRVLVELALGTGARIGELAALRWSAFDPEACTVRIQWQAPVSGTTTLRSLKGKRARTALCLPEWWAHYTATVGDADPRTLGAVLSSDPRAEYVSIGATDEWVSLVLDRAQCNEPGRGAHAFRHTYARLFIERGGRLEHLQKSLGHSSIRTTEQSYAWLAGDTAAALARSAIYPDAGLTLMRSAKKQKAR